MVIILGKISLVMVFAGENEPSDGQSQDLETTTASGLDIAWLKGYLLSVITLDLKTLSTSHQNRSAQSPKITTTLCCVSTVNEISVWAGF